MTFEEKLQLRKKLLMEFAVAGKSTPRQILQADFAEDVTSTNPLLDEEFKISFFDRSFLGLVKRAIMMAFEIQAEKHKNRPAIVSFLIASVDSLIWFATYKMKLSGEQQRGFNLSIRPNEIFVYKEILHDRQLSSDTISHETGHVLQKRYKIKDSFRKMTKDDIREEFHAPKKNLNWAVYNTSEEELMPRLHQLLSSFYMMGGKMPRTEIEFTSFLNLFGVYENDSPEILSQGRALFSEEDVLEIKKLFEVNSVVIQELKAAVIVTKDKQKIHDFMVTSYLNLIKIYGQKISQDEFNRRSALDCNCI